MWDQYLCVGEEGPWGVEVPRTEFHRTFEDSIMTPAVPFRPLGTLGLADPVQKFKETESGVFAFAIPAVYDGMGHFLKYAMGDASSTGAGPYEHVYVLDDNPYTRASNPLIGLSAELALQLPDAAFESQLLTGGRISNWGMAFAQNEEVKLTGELSGKTIIAEPVTGSPTFPDYDHVSASPLILPSQTVVSIDGGGTDDVDGAEFSVNNGLRLDRAFLGSAFVDGGRRQGRREITGSIDMRYVDKTLWNKWRNQLSATLSITCTGPGILDLTIDFAKIYFTGDPLALEAGEDQAQTLPWVAYKTADGANDAMIVTVNNNTTLAL